MTGYQEFEWSVQQSWTKLQKLAWQEAHPDMHQSSFGEFYLDRVKQKGTAPQQLLQNWIGRVYDLHEQGCADFCENPSKYSA